MQEHYEPISVEKEAQENWMNSQAYYADENNRGKKKFYACSMLPYPSGKLHMGHVRNYTINDVLARQLRMQGFNVLMPMGWDAFGMPAENAATINEISPCKWTYSNIAYMKKQLLSMGLSIDWSRELCTCDPDYYKWNQWMFLKMLKHGIAYRKTQIVNWDPIDQTVLAKEQVINGRGWRSGAIIQKRAIPGYYLRITKYADELLKSAEKLKDWPEKVLSMQENWIGKSEGIQLFFTHSIKDSNGLLIQDGKLHVFTTRPDTIMGVTFCAISPEHPLALHAEKKSPELKLFIEELRRNACIEESEFAKMEIKGAYTGLNVIHPITGKPIQVWVSNYVKSDYGQGAIMGVPGHNEYDFLLAKSNGIPIIQIAQFDGKLYELNLWKDWYTGKDYSHTINSSIFNNLKYENASKFVIYELQKRGVGNKCVNYRLHDWSISRQRYWGTPIPIIHCKNCGLVPVPESELPVILPNNLIPNGTGNPLLNENSFISCLCPQCKGIAKRETDTMDTFFDSSWYFMRYTSSDNSDSIIDERTHYWMPVDQYIGGIEHAILHLLYARFWTKVMRDIGLIKFDEPFKKVLCQGMVLNHTYSRKSEAGELRYFNANQIENIYDKKQKIIGAHLKSDKSLVEYNGMISMSKSKSNGIDPQHIIETLGADTARLFIMFANSPERNIEWSDSGLNGSNRFLHRIWSICYKNRAFIKPNKKTNIDQSQVPESIKDFRQKVHSILDQADRDYQRIHYNTVISSAMKLTNIIDNITGSNTCNYEDSITEGIGILLRILYPIIPHITWKLWKNLGYELVLGNLVDAPWPEVDKVALDKKEIQLVLQINGKRRDNFLVPKNINNDQIKTIALAQKAAKKFLSGKPPKRIIIVPRKLVNIVV